MAAAQYCEPTGRVSQTEYAYVIQLDTMTEHMATVMVRKQMLTGRKFHDGAKVAEDGAKLPRQGAKPREHGA